jgi:hypothetical protein
LELGEVIGRFFDRHRKLLAELLAGFAIHMDDAPQYSASARLVLDTSDPEDQAQSGVIADTTRAIASGRSTSPTGCRSLATRSGRPPSGRRTYTDAK